jgi:hypothetical protein
VIASGNCQPILPIYQPLWQLWTTPTCPPRHRSATNLTTSSLTTLPPNNPNRSTTHAGVKKAVNENQNLWGSLTADTPTPYLEFDYLGADAWEGLGRGARDVAGMGAGDKLEMRTKQVGCLVSLVSNVWSRVLLSIWAG